MFTINLFIKVINGMNKHIVRIGILMLTLSSFVLATDWPQYLGPNRNAVSTETGIKRTWPTEGPEVLWTVQLGEGYGGAAVSKGVVYLLDRDGESGDVLRAFDLISGKQNWTFAYDAPGVLDRGGSRSVPAIDGNYIYACGPFGHFHCVDIRTHKAVWAKNVWTDYSSEDLPRWGIAQNPLIYGDLVILASQTQKTGLVAYDKSTGEEKWASPALPGKAGYVSPKIVTLEGEDHVVMISADGAVMGLEPQTGKQIWSYSGWQCKIPVPNVTEIGDGRIFITGGYRAGSAMIRVEKKSGSFVVSEEFKTDEFGTHVHPAILHDGHLYGHCSTNETRDGLMCLSLDGKVKWETGRNPLFDKGGFILVDGLFLSVDGNKGWLYLIEPSPDGFKELSKAKLLDTITCWAPLALSDGKLLIRDQKQMKCVVVK
jgi:outer membrane protein assembly factor BamB